MRDAWEIARLTGAELGAAYADGSLSPPRWWRPLWPSWTTPSPSSTPCGTAPTSRPRPPRRRAPNAGGAVRPRGPLDGVPATVKENLARAGVPMPAGNAGVVPVVPDRSSPVVERLDRGGRR